MSLEDVMSGWRPRPLVEHGEITPWPATAFSGLLDLEDRVFPPGSAIPPLWHWLYLLGHPRRGDLGEDGHPTVGPLLPPIADRRRMFAGGRVSFVRDLVVGDQVTRTSSVVGKTVKLGRSGELAFVTIRSESCVAGTAAVIEEQDIVYRSERATHRAVPDRDRAVDAPTADEMIVRTQTDSRLLFGFSALTYNAHRIHYDLPYATEVEGYPALVVHGPLLALLMAELPRRYDERKLKSFEFRLRAPIYGGEEAVMRSRRRSDGELELSAAAHGFADSATARAVFHDG